MSLAEPVRQSIRVRVPAARAFAIFTQQVDGWWPESHRRFPESTLTLAPGEGGQLVERSASGEVHQLGEVVTWEPPGRLAFSWRLGAPPTAPTLATIRFTEEHDTTLVEVVHVEGPHALPDWVRTARIFTSAWRHVLDAFAAHLPSES
mgnify:CR=1 FL=1